MIAFPNLRGDLLDLAANWARMSEIAKALVKNLDKKEYSAIEKQLGQAISSQNIELVAKLLQQGADPNAYVPSLIPNFFSIELPTIMQTPALIAAINSNQSAAMVKLLLAAGADPNKEAIVTLFGNNIKISPLESALSSQRIESMKLLLEHGASITSTDSKPLLIQAIENKFLEGVILLLQYGADVKASDFQGRTPLAVATALGDLEIIDLLKKVGAPSWTVRSFLKKVRYNALY